MGTSPHDSFWRDEAKTEKLKKMVALGLSGRQIAEELGSVTRGAVIGRAHRLGLKLCGKPDIERRPHETLTDLPADESPDAVRFLDRDGDTCRWPLNDTVPISEHMVCGSACDGEHSYCSRHYRLSVNPSRPRTLDLSEAERARRVAQGRKNRAAYKENLAAS